MGKKGRQLLAGGMILLLAAVALFLFLKNRQQTDFRLSARWLLQSNKGQDPRTVTKAIFENRGCAQCHGFTQKGAFGLNRQGQILAEGFEGCEIMLATVKQTLSIPEAVWTGRQRTDRSNFVSFGCSVCHQVADQNVALTELGAQAGDLLHKGCLDMCCPLRPGSTPR